MTIRISRDVLEKITERNIRVIEIDQCFLNRSGGLCDDTRAHHLTNPITKWFVAETDKGRLLKIMYVPTAEGVDLKSAYEATAEICRIYEKYAKYNRSIKMANTEKIKDTVEAWENGTLGNDEQYVRRASPEAEKELDDALGLQSISIRLPKELIEQFKLISKIHGMGYQPLMREALKRFAAAEIKVILTQMANEGKIETLENGKQKVEVELNLDQRRAA